MGKKEKKADMSNSNFQKSLKKLMKESTDSQTDGVGAVLGIQLLADGINMGAAGDPQKIAAVLAAAMDSEEHIKAIILTAASLVEAKDSGKLDEFLKNNKPTTEA